MKRIMLSLFAFAWVLFLGWFGGVDFYYRNYHAAFWGAFATFAFGAVYYFPGWKE